MRYFCWFFICCSKFFFEEVVLSSLSWKGCKRLILDLRLANISLPMFCSALGPDPSVFSCADNKSMVAHWKCWRVRSNTAGVGGWGGCLGFGPTVTDASQCLGTQHSWSSFKPLTDPCTSPHKSVSSFLLHTSTTCVWEAPLGQSGVSLRKEGGATHVTLIFALYSPSGSRLYLVFLPVCVFVLL